MTRVIKESADATVAQQSPGYLMAPFGWAAKPLAAMLEPIWLCQRRLCALQ
jgi:hypothetical protein